MWWLGASRLAAPLLAFASPFSPILDAIVSYRISIAHADQNGGETLSESDSASSDDVETESNQLSLLSSYKYILVGSGTASHSALVEIRKHDTESPVLMIGRETYPPYMRPPLSKELWDAQDEEVLSTLQFTNYRGRVQGIEYHSVEEYKSKFNCDLLLGHEVVELDADDRIVVIDDGRKFSYEKCLLAVGGKPYEVPVADSSISDRITTFRTAADFKRLYSASRKGATFAVIGGSFLGTEIAYALSKQTQKSGGDVIQIFPEPSVMARNFPRYLSQAATRHLNSCGVTVRPNRMVEKLGSRGGKVVLTLDNKEEIEVDHVVVCVGIEPNVDLARRANLEIDMKNGGIVTNSELEARSGIYAAGDVCSFFDPVLGRRRVEHHDHAEVSGRLAGANMAGQHEAYGFQSMFWGFVGELGYEAIGNLDSSADTVAFWDNVQVDADGAPWFFSAPSERIENYGRGVVYFLKHGRVDGILLWNNYGKMKYARKVLGRKIPRDDLKNKIPL